MEFLIPITMFMCIAAVMILRPLTKQLGAFLEVATKERALGGRPQQPQQQQDTDAARTILLLEHVTKRMDVMEERLDFTERLVSTNQRNTPQLSVRNMSDIGLRDEPLHGAVR
jgi:hypothetical protein